MSVCNIPDRSAWHHVQYLSLTLIRCPKVSAQGLKHTPRKASTRVCVCVCVSRFPAVKCCAGTATRNEGLELKKGGGGGGRGLQWLRRRYYCTKRGHFTGNAKEETQMTAGLGQSVGLERFRNNTTVEDRMDGVWSEGRGATELQERKDVPRLDLAKLPHICFHSIRYSLNTSAARGGCVHTGTSNIRDCALTWKRKSSAFSGDHARFR